jgi:AcrR family transcriptional regulator
LALRFLGAILWHLPNQACHCYWQTRKTGKTMPTKPKARSTLTRGRIGRPSKSVSEALDETLLTLAIQALREANFSEISLDKLAARIGVSKPTIYRRFTNRSALIEAMVEREFASLLKTDVGPGLLPGEGEAADPSDPLGHLRRYAWELFQFSLRPSTANFVGFLYQEALLNPRIAQLRHEWHLSVVNHLAQIIREVQATGRFAPSDPCALASLLVDLMNTALTLYPLGFSQEDALSGMAPEEYFKWRFDIFLNVASRPSLKGTRPRQP